MSGFRLHTPTAITSSIQGNTWQTLPSDQQSKTSEQSGGTVQRVSYYSPSSGSARSLRSNSSACLQSGNENLAARRNASYPSFKFSPYTTSPVMVGRKSKQASHRASQENDLPRVPHEQRVSSLLAEEVPLEDIDLNAGCGESLCIRHEVGQDADDNPGRGLSFDIRKQETLSIPRLPSSASQEMTSPRSFKVASEHPVKSENPVKRLIGTLRTQGPRRRHSLTVRKERWILDDFEDTGSTELDLLQNERLNGHHKASSWTSSGIRNAIKSATVKLHSATSRPHSPIFARARLLKSNRGSRVSNATTRVSLDGDQVVARLIDHAARERAVQRRRVVEELVSSEESYVADLKVLLHVGGPYNSRLRLRIADTTFQGLLLHAKFRAKGPSSYTTRDISERCRYAALARRYPT